MSEILQDVGKNDIAFDNEQDRVTGGNSIPVILYTFLLYRRNRGRTQCPFRGFMSVQCRALVGYRRYSLQLRLDDGRRRNIHLRQVKGKRATHIQLTVESDLSTKQTRDLPANREAQSRPSVLPTSGSVRLLEGLENQYLLALRNTNPGIRNRIGYDGFSAIEHRVFWAPPTRSARNAQFHPSALRKFQSVR